MKLLFAAVVVVLVVMPISLAAAATIEVTPNSGTIQSAIDAASNGDVVGVGAGTYTGSGNRDLDFKGKAITVRGAGPGLSIIDCQGVFIDDEHRGVYFHTGEGADSVFEGFTIINGVAQAIIGEYGGGIWCSDGTAPTIRNCRIADCSSFAGGGISCRNSSTTIEDCTIEGNNANRGGGVWGLWGSPMTITRCIVRDNSANDGGGLSLDEGTVVTNCIIEGNSCSGDGGGVLSTGGATIRNCTIADNTAGDCGAIYCQYSEFTVERCILWGNVPNEVSGVAPDVSYSDIENGSIEAWFDPGTCLDADPMLDADYRLTLSSPCIDWCPTGPADDIDGEARPLDIPGTGFDDPPDARTFDIGADELVFNVTTAVYVNGTTGSDAYDGLAPEWDGVHGPKATIQAGILAVSDVLPGTVTVADGVYRGPGNRDIQFGAKPLTVRSAHGADSCIVDCERAGSGFWLNGDTADAVLDGFRIVHVRYASIYGGGVTCTGGSTVKNCIITQCSGFGFVSGICVVRGSPTVENCLIIGDDPLVLSTGISCLDGSNPTIVNCTIAGNPRRGVYCSAGSNLTMHNCIVWGNGGDQILTYQPSVSVHYSCVQDGTGEPWFDPATCIDADPLFVSGPLHGYYLSQVAAGQAVESPCVDAGSDTAAALGLDGLTTRIDGGRDDGVVDMGYHAAPAPFITSIARSGDDVVIEWNGLAGVPYVLAWTDEWWSEAATWNEVSVGAVETWTDTGVVSGMPVATMRRYRVREDAAPTAPSPMVEALFESALTGTGSTLPVSTSSGKRVPTAPLPGSSSRGPVRGGPNVREGGNVRAGAGNASAE